MIFRERSHRLRETIWCLCELRTDQSKRRTRDSARGGFALWWYNFPNPAPPYLFTTVRVGHVKHCGLTSKSKTGANRRGLDCHGLVISERAIASICFAARRRRAGCPYCRAPREQAVDGRQIPAARARRDIPLQGAGAGASRCVWQIPCKRVQGIFWKPGNFCENKLDVVGEIEKTADG